MRKKEFLRQIMTGTLGPTTGEHIFSRAGQTFPGGIDQDFLDWFGGVRSHPTMATNYGVFEQIKDGTLGDILGDFGRKSRRRFFWTEAQVVELVQTYPSMLHPKGAETFFPCYNVLDKGTRNERNEFFVVAVYRTTIGRLKVHPLFLADKHHWLSQVRHRFVVPQQPSGILGFFQSLF